MQHTTSDEVMLRIADALESAQRNTGLLHALSSAQEADIRALHTALNEITALFVSEHGYDYTAVTDALQALRRSHERYPVTMALAEKMRELWPAPATPSTDMYLSGREKPEE